MVLSSTTIFNGHFEIGQWSSLYFSGMADQCETAHNELAQKAYERLKTLAQGLTAWQATRTTCRLSRWANPMEGYKQGDNKRYD